MLEFKRCCPLIEAVVVGMVEANSLLNLTINHWIEWEVVHAIPESAVIGGCGSQRWLWGWQLSRKRRMKTYN
jgi:hypothetical protein